MKNASLRTLVALAFAVPILTFSACGKKTETVVIEKPAPVQIEVEEKKPNVSVSVEGDGKNTRYEVHGEK